LNRGSVPLGISLGIYLGTYLGIHTTHVATERNEEQVADNPGLTHRTGLSESISLQTLSHATHSSSVL
jgi:hypothetical protein